MAWRWANVPLPEIHLTVLALGFALHRVRPRRLGLAPVARLAGVCAVAVGAELIRSAVAASGTTRLDDPDRVVTTGPYAQLRHPMYAGWTLCYGGLTLVVDSGWLLAGLPLVVASTDLTARREEQRLEQELGPAYLAYIHRVPRWGLGKPR